MFILEGKDGKQFKVQHAVDAAEHVKFNGCKIVQRPNIKVKGQDTGRKAPMPAAPKYPDSDINPDSNLIPDDEKVESDGSHDDALAEMENEDNSPSKSDMVEALKAAGVSVDGRTSDKKIKELYDTHIGDDND